MPRYRQHSIEPKSRLQQTVTEAVFILLTICSCGIMLGLVIKTGRTDGSYIHCLFKPIDDIILDPRLRDDL